ncbi:hypothetical protein KEM54_005592 [Ascosphaera aggregata]|nr:hypothetical protein KEM54_005592 [Ascosphaera aggregata]
MSRDYACRTFDRRTTLQSIPESPCSHSSTSGNRYSFQDRNRRSRVDEGEGDHNHENGENNCFSSSDEGQSPLPTRQLLVLAIISFAEQTALNSIAPYLPHMAATLTSSTSSTSPLIGLYVGIIASAFASAQFLTNFFWGWLSDRIGRKPVILAGAILTAICFVLFGLCRRLWQVIVVQAVMGMVNGNAGLIPACLGEITDRSNQSIAFTYLPVIYGLGAIVGPVLGGALAPNDARGKKFPYLLSNLVVAVLLVAEFLIAAVYLDESLDSARAIHWEGVWRRIKLYFVRVWEVSFAVKPHYSRVNRHGRDCGGHHNDRNGRLQGCWTDSIEGADTASDGSEASSSCTPLFSEERENGEHAFRYGVSRKEIVLIFTTYALFQLSHVSFNSLYPIFSQAPAPLGRGLTPNEIGISLGFAGIATIVFQVFLFGLIRGVMGNKTSYQLSLFLLILPFILMPFIGYKSDHGSHIENDKTGKAYFLLAVEVCCILLLKTVATVCGLTSSLLLVGPTFLPARCACQNSKPLTSASQITNSVPTHSSLGFLNGLAQTLSAGGRGIGPLLSGGLFSLASKMEIGAFLAFGVFAAVAFIAFLLSLGIRSEVLENDKD